MAVREIVLYPDDRLRMTCQPVDTFDDELRELIADMVDTMYDAPGIGLAAPQIGVDARVIVIDLRDREDGEEGDPGQLYVLVNPEIVESEGTIKWEEGCLSIPGVYEDVKRHARVKVRTFDGNGDPYEIESDGLLAVCLQHEIDHLNGVLFLDHLSRLKLRMALKTYKRTKAQHLAELEEKRKKEAGEGDTADETSAAG